MTLEFLNGLHFFPLEKVFFTVFITFSRGKKSRYCHIVDNLRGKKPHVPRFLSHVMFNQPFCDTHLFNFYLFLL